MESRQITLHLTDEVQQELDFISEATNRSPSSVAAEVLALNIPVHAQRMRKIQEAKNQATTGACISQAAMEAWVESLGTDDELPPPEPDVFRK